MALVCASIRSKTASIIVFKLINETGYYTLYVLKNKKELKEDSSSSFKVIGYYVSLYSALKRVLAYRRDKKYSGKESDKDLLILLKQLREAMNAFDQIKDWIYQPILELKTRLIKYK